MESVRRKPNASRYAKFKKFETAESNFRRAYVTERPSAKSVPWFIGLQGTESLLTLNLLAPTTVGARINP